MSHRIAYFVLALGIVGTVIASGCAEGTVDLKGNDDAEDDAASNGSTNTSSSASASTGGGGATSTTAAEASSSSAEASSSAESSSSTSASSSAVSSSSSSAVSSSASAVSSSASAVSSSASAVSSTSAVSSSSGGPVCGDAFCDASAGEDCATCVVDCGCAPVCGDAICEAAGGEDCTTCAADCGACGSCAHDVCDTGPALVDGCDPCVTQVCATDSFCCTMSWDSMCVDEAESICGASCGGGCAHDVCDVGPALVIGCDPCVAQVCFIDSFCCTTSWDITCVDWAATFCFACP